MRRIFAHSRQNKVERTMRISERRQEAGRPALLPDQRQEEIPWSGSRPSLATATVPDCIGKRRKSLSEQSDAMSDGKLVHAVCNATASEESVSDEMLLKGVAEGDKAAMHIMFARHRARVFRFIQRMVSNPTIADDLVSQVFLDVWRSANRFESRSRVSTWLLSIARLKAISFLRQRTHENIDKGDVLGIADAGDTPEVALDRKETHGILYACVSNLSPAHREIINLFYYREKSIAEVSEIIGIPHATARSRLFYARKQLAGSLVSVGFA
jgi:RNA polymerase sigma-70 factor (ECF subfamily)